MKYAVDKIEEDLVTLENIETKEIETVSIGNLPKNIKEGTILKKMYVIDTEEETKRKKNIKSIFDKLKN